MFGMNGFHVSASGAIQGHHGPLVDLDLTDDLDLGTKEQVLSQGIHIQNMKALSLTIQKLLLMLKLFFVDKWTNRQMMQKLYGPYPWGA